MHLLNLFVGPQNTLRRPYFGLSLVRVIYPSLIRIIQLDWSFSGCFSSLAWSQILGLKPLITNKWRNFGHEIPNP